MYVVTCSEIKVKAVRCMTYIIQLFTSISVDMRIYLPEKVHKSEVNITFKGR